MAGNEPKQVIVMRTDLNMRKGKMVAFLVGLLFPIISFPFSAVTYGTDTCSDYNSSRIEGRIKITDKGVEYYDIKAFQYLWMLYGGATALSLTYEIPSRNEELVRQMDIRCRKYPDAHYGISIPLMIQETYSKLQQDK